VTLDTDEVWKMMIFDKYLAISPKTIHWFSNPLFITENYQDFIIGLSSADIAGDLKLPLDTPLRPLSQKIQHVTELLQW